MTKIMKVKLKSIEIDFSGHLIQNVRVSLNVIMMTIIASKNPYDSNLS